MATDTPTYRLPHTTTHTPHWSEIDLGILLAGDSDWVRARMFRRSVGRDQHLHPAFVGYKDVQSNMR